MTAITDLMAAQRSVRRFKPEAPPRKLLQELIAAAITAPSTSSQPPWRFVLVTNRRMIAQLADAARHAQERIAKHIRPDLFETYFQRTASFSQLETAPALVVPTYRPVGFVSPFLGRPLGRKDARFVGVVEELSGLVSTSLALQNLLLATHACGLGAAVMIGPLVALEAINELLAVPPSWHVAAMVAVGYPDEFNDPVPRPAVGAVTIWLE